MQIIISIQNRIYEIRGTRIILDNDLAFLYHTETKILNQAVRRNLNRFPGDFMFQLTESEYEAVKSKIKNSETENSLRFQIGTSKRRGGNRYLPYAFTEQGVAMLSSVLNSDEAIQMNISIMRAFIEIRRLAFQEIDLKRQLQEIKDVLGTHDHQLNQIYDAMENLLDEKAAERKWNDRERIGFNKAK
jgi:hypothetical protein